MKIFSALGNVKNRLTRIGKNEPLNFLSIVIIIALDIFVLWNVFQGLGLQTKQLTTPQEAVPYDCQRLVDIKNWQGTDSRWQKTDSVLSRSNGFYSNGNYKMSADFINDKRNNKIISECRAVYDAAEKLRSQTQLVNKNKQIETLERMIRNLEKNSDSQRDQYDTMLLERIADQDERYSLTDGSAREVKGDIANNQAGITRHERDINRLKSEILKDPAAISFLNALANNEESIRAQLKTLKFWYPLKRLAFQFVFLLPLLIVFGICYQYCVRKDRSLLILIFSHLLIIVCIPIIIEIFRLFMDILPFHFFKDLIALLDAMGLVALWNYILILFGILAALALIYFVQKKLFAHRRQMLKRIAKGKCCHCGIKLSPKSTHCYSCGEANLKKCGHCSQPTFTEGAHCQHCGKEDF